MATGLLSSEVKWLFYCVKQVFSLDKYRLVLAFLAGFFSQVCQTISFLLPLKIILLMASDGYPAWMPEAVQVYPLKQFILALSVLTLVFAAFGSLMDWVVTRLLHRTTEKVVNNAQQRDFLTGTKHEQVEPLLQVMMKVLVASLIILVFGACLAYVYPKLLVPVVLFLLIVFWLFSRREEGRCADFELTLIEKPQSMVVVFFMAAFFTLVYDYLAGVQIPMLFLLISLMLVRQLLSREAVLISSLDALYKNSRPLVGDEKSQRKADSYSLAFEEVKTFLLEQAEQRFGKGSEVSAMQLMETDGSGRFFCQLQLESQGCTHSGVAMVSPAFKKFPSLSAELSLLLPEESISAATERAVISGWTVELMWLQQCHFAVDYHSKVKLQGLAALAEKSVQFSKAGQDSGLAKRLNNDFFTALRRIDALLNDSQRQLLDDFLAKTGMVGEQIRCLPTVNIYQKPDSGMILLQGEQAETTLLSVFYDKFSRDTLGVSWPDKKHRIEAMVCDYSTLGKQFGIEPRDVLRASLLHKIERNFYANNYKKCFALIASYNAEF